MSKFLTGLVFVFFSIFFVALSFWRYFGLQVFYYDLGIFARIIWLLSRFQIPYIDHNILGYIVFLGDHFNPSLAILAPLFWLARDLKILLAEQALATVVSGFILYKISQKFNLSKTLALLLAVSFFLFAGTGNPLVTDWHPESTAGTFLLLFIYTLLFLKKPLLTWGLAFIFLGFKESNTISLSLVLIWGVLTRLVRIRTALPLIVFVALWYGLSIYFFIPYFSGGTSYTYAPILPASVSEFLIGFSQNPQKLKLIVDSLLSFGFIPLLAPSSLILVFGELAVRLLPSQSRFENFTLGMHYNVFLGIFLTLSVIRVVSRFKKWETLICLVLLVFSLYAARKITSSPVNLAINPVFWKQVFAPHPVIKLLSAVPKEGTIMSQNNLLPHFVQRKEKIYLLSREYNKIMPDMIVMAPDQGGNINNYWGSNDVDSTLNSLLNDPCYKQYAVPMGDLFIFQKRPCFQ